MYRKGMPDLIKAAPGVIKEHPQARFIIVGKDKSVDRLKRLCDDLNVDRNFEFAGWQSQDSLLSYYQQASVFVMPSLTEALGVTFLEAMAAGVPVIGTNVGGIPRSSKTASMACLFLLSLRALSQMRLINYWQMRSCAKDLSRVHFLR